MAKEGGKQALQHMMNVSNSATNAPTTSGNGSKLSIKKKMINSIQMQ